MTVTQRLGSHRLGSRPLAGAPTFGVITLAIESPRGVVDGTLSQVSWVYSESNGRPQHRYRITLTTPNGTELHDSGWIQSDATTHTINYAFAGNSSYVLELRVQTTQGQQAFASSPFTVVGSIERTVINFDVGTLYDVAINGVGYMLVTEEGDIDWGRRTISLEAPRFTTGETPFNESVERYSFIGQNDWSGGRGQLEGDRPGWSETAFLDSDGIDPFTEPGELRLLPVTEKLTANTHSNPKLTVLGDALFMLTGAKTLGRFTGSTGSSFNVNAAGTITDLISDGRFWYVADGTGVWRGATAADPGATPWSTEDVVRMVWAGHRICAAVIGAGSTTANVFKTLLDDGTQEAQRLVLPVGYDITSLSGGGGYLYFSAAAGNIGAIYAWQIGSNDAPFVVWELPAGEIPQAVYWYQNNLFIRAARQDTTVLYRAAVSGDGRISPFLFAELDESLGNVGDFVGRGRFVFFSWSALSENRGGIGCVDLAGGGYAKWLKALEESNGPINSIEVWRGKLVFSVTGNGVYVESSTTVAEGHLDTSIRDGGSALEKVWDEVLLQARPLTNNSSIFVAYSLDRGSSYIDFPAGTLVGNGQYRRATRLGVTSPSIGWRITLKGGGARLRVLQARAHPLGLADHVLVLPIDCSDDVTLRNGQIDNNQAGDGSIRLRQLEALAQSQVRVQDIDWRNTGLVEDYEVIGVEARRTRSTRDPAGGTVYSRIVAIVTMRRTSGSGQQVGRPNMDVRIVVPSINAHANFDVPTVPAGDGVNATVPVSTIGARAQVPASSPVRGTRVLPASIAAVAHPRPVDVAISSPPVQQKRAVIGLHGAGGGFGPGNFGSAANYPVGPFETVEAPDPGNTYRVNGVTKSTGIFLPAGYSYTPGPARDAVINHIQAIINNEGYTHVIIHGFSYGGGMAASIYAGGEDFGGTLVGVVIDDAAFYGGWPATPNPNVKAVMYSIFNGGWVIGDGNVVANEQALGLTSKVNPYFTSHHPMTRNVLSGQGPDATDEELTDIWWGSGGGGTTPPPPSDPKGKRIVVGLAGINGTTDLEFGFGGPAYPKADWFTTRAAQGNQAAPGGGFQWNLNDYASGLASVQAAAGNDPEAEIILHGFSDGGKFLLEMIRRGETLGGRVKGYVLDDPNYNPNPISNPAGVRVVLYAVQQSDGQWFPNILAGFDYMTQLENDLQITRIRNPFFNTHHPMVGPHNNAPGYVKEEGNPSTQDDWWDLAPTPPPPPSGDVVTVQAETFTLVNPAPDGMRVSQPGAPGGFSGGYNGTGYIGYWYTSGERVRFQYNASSVGTHQFAFRYRSAMDGAQRLVFVNGTQVATLAFPRTAAAWSDTTFGTATVNLNLNAGTNTIELVVPSTVSGVDLDEVTITAPDSGEEPPPPPPPPPPTEHPMTIQGVEVFPADHYAFADISGLPVRSDSNTRVNGSNALPTFRPEWGAAPYNNNEVYPDFGPGLQNGRRFGYPLIVVEANAPTFAITQWRYGYSQNESDDVPLPIPLDTLQEHNSDFHILCLQKGTNRLFELWDAHPFNGGWSVGQATMWDLTSLNQRPAGITAANAAGTPMLPLSINYDEVAAGEVTHAASICMTYVSAEYEWPANHVADFSQGVRSDLMKMGTWLRLKAGVNLDARGLGPQARVIAEGLKKHGAIVIDVGPKWKLNALADDRWDRDDLMTLMNLRGPDFEVVDVSSLIVDERSMRINTSVTPPPPDDDDDGEESPPTGGGGTGLFEVQGRSIINPDGRRVRLVGANGSLDEFGPNGAFIFNMPVTNPPNGSRSYFSGFVEDVKAWGWNIVRVPLVPTASPGGPTACADRIIAMIDEFSAQKIVVMPVPIEYQAQNRGPGDGNWPGYVEFWNRVLTARGSNPYLWVNFAGESWAGGADSGWVAQQNYFYNFVRNRAPNTVICFTCPGQGQDGAGPIDSGAWNTLASGKSRIILDWHAYAAFGGASAARTIYNKIKSANVPLIIGEFAWPQTPASGPPAGFNPGACCGASYANQRSTGIAVIDEFVPDGTSAIWWIATGDDNSQCTHSLRYNPPTGGTYQDWNMPFSEGGQKFWNRSHESHDLGPA